MTRLVEVEGIGEIYAAKLEAIGVNSIEQLLEMGATKQGRENLSQKSGVSETLILNWINRADLARIKGIASEYADLLEAAGVDSVPELAQRNAANLHARLMETNEEENLVRRVPSESEVADWIDQAQKLPRIVMH